MRLAHIKLAGFKSFVDPTNISLPGQLVGIVGPNGCGKSNVIDALRWVLGESRASALRGESMQDVIFNGAGTRKPVARASVELVFDNSLGKVGGQWATYAEISIKRVLQRDGESSYFINNQHVRRKDITDIFLGTGVGARAYAIIEQGMISRIIEAKPEELRVFLEEAAGVSKYRDRRRETELRLGDTRDNLSRVYDIQQELEKQLKHLAEQAEVAKTYRELEARRDTTQKLLWLVNKQEAESRRVRYAQQVEKTKTELEGEIAKLREVEAKLETARSDHFGLSDALHAKQGELYATNAEVARLEQQIAFITEQRNRLSQQIQNGERQIAQQQTQLQGLRTLRTHWQQQKEDAAVRVATCEERSHTEAQSLPQVEEAARLALERFNSMQREQMLIQQQLQIFETQRGHVQGNVQQLDSRRSRLMLERDNLPQTDMEALEQSRQQLAEMQAEHEMQQQQLAELQERLPLADAERRAKRDAVQELQRQSAQTEARLHALQQLQAQLDNDKNLKAWLSQHQLDSAPRLWQSIRIEQGWEDALEAVLRERINALALPNLQVAASWSDLPPAKLAVYAADGGHSNKAAVQSGLTPLANYVRCQDAQAAPVVEDWLAGVYAVATLDEALAQRNNLPGGAWLVTAQGHLVGAHSVLFHAPDSQLHGVLARQREIEALQQEAAQHSAALEQGKQQSAAAEEAYHTVEGRIAPLRGSTSELQQRQHGAQMQILKLTQANERTQERNQQIAQELEELAERVENEQRQLQEIAEQMEIQREKLSTQQIESDQTRQQSTTQDNLLREQRDRAQKAQHELQEARFFAKTCAEKLADLEQNLHQHGETLTQLEEALAHSRNELANLSEGVADQQLQGALQQRQVHEQALAEARNIMENATMNLNRMEQERMACEQKLHPLREKVGEITLKEQEARLQYEQWAEQLQGVDEEPLLPLIEGAKASGLQNELTRLSNEITALGAVNLAALEELQAAQERKDYLDAQAKDLNEAVETLEAAIRRIDKESRDLLMATYDEVNRHLSELFPILFGGGDAKLVLTGDEILDSGVQVMAHPPGKKNASIHLLSGGEKALTAIALVFSLFQLNPAPFCVLDEVDAPLDDTNTERLCKLIQKMSDKTQFVYISHNKITMEMAQQLIGVTMQERGVSKVVSVDIEEAMKLSENSGGNATVAA
ncbi:MAG: chromosome segregation protein SMC [Gammaproteobacteria bacterium]|nr:chromosome segregation protein SMC [Gammaproteobacteria bacterium]MBU1775604.1 chromosome segregation protein SMC [Gammaproteobacteria bacterium]MBU1967726.1 chromosome segregation protein SMC [Gammaproteobacteria bacterium]